MKIDLKPSIVQMEPEVLTKLVREVKETLATDIQMPAGKEVFSEGKISVPVIFKVINCRLHQLLMQLFF